MATSTITGVIQDPENNPLEGITVIARLKPRSGFITATGETVAPVAITTTDSNGNYSFELERNSGITPEDTWYNIEERIPDVYGGGNVWEIQVGASDATVYASLVTPTPSSDFSNYLTQAAADARYALVAATGGFGINVKDAPYSATGDGVTNDYSAIQAAFTAARTAANRTVYFPAGAYRCNTATALYLDGDVTVIMDPSAYILVDNAETKGGATIFMALGINARWTGKLLYCNFRQGDTLVTRGATFLGILIAPFDAERALIEGCTIYSTSTFTQTNMIKGLNNSSWKTVAGTVRRDIKVLNNTIDVAQDAASGGEGISFSGVSDSVRAERILIQGNTVKGMGDDPIAIHSGENVKILGNTCKTVDGRIFCSDVEDVKIADNSLEHTGAGSAFIQLALESATSAILRPPTDIQITNNKLIVPSGDTSSYGIRCLGCQDVEILGNKVRNKNTSGSVLNAISIEGCTDADGTLRKAGYITIQGNHIRGGRIAIAAAANRDAWTKVGPNTIDGKGLIDDLLDFPSAGDVAGDEVMAVGAANPSGTAHYNTGGEAVTNLQLLGIWHLENVPDNTTTFLALQDSALNAIEPQVDFAICAVVSRFAAAPSHTATINVCKEAALWKAASHTAAAGAQTVNYGASNARYSRETHTAGTASTIQVSVTTPAGWTATQDLRVELWGVPVP